MTKPILMKEIRPFVWMAIFIVGNGGAYNNWHMLFKKGSKEEVTKWANKIVIPRDNKWETKVSSTEWLRKLFPNTKPFIPDMAGQDYGEVGIDNNGVARYIIDYGFETVMLCNNDNNDNKNYCQFNWNEGSRKKPIKASKRINIDYDDIESIFISHGAGRSSKETIYIDSKNIIFC